MRTWITSASAVHLVRYRGSVGHSSSDYFYHIFRKIQEVSLQQYRKQSLEDSIKPTVDGNERKLDADLETFL